MTSAEMLEKMAHRTLNRARERNGIVAAGMVKCMDWKCDKILYKDEAYKIRYGTKNHNFCYQCYLKHLRLKKNQESAL